MPFDDAGTSAAQDGAARDRRAVALWLFGMCGMIWVMVALGGATRLTGSGLSIMEWAPLRGALPPLSDAEWQRLYALYQSIPQYELVNKGFGLDGFKRIFWLEWAHRLWGRLIGLAFLLPLIWFAAAAVRLKLTTLGLLQYVAPTCLLGLSVLAYGERVEPHRALMLALIWVALALYTIDALRLRRSPEAGPVRSDPDTMRV